MLHSLRCVAASLAAVSTFGLATTTQAAVDLMGATDATFQWPDAQGPNPIDSYLVFVSRNGGAFETVAQIIVPTASATVSGNEGESVAIRVQALDSQGNLGPLSSASDTVNFLAAPPPPPTTETTAPPPETDMVTRPTPTEPPPDDTTTPPDDTTSPPPDDTTNPPPVDPGTRVVFDLDADARSEVIVRHGTTGELEALSTDGQSILAGNVIAALSDPGWSVVGAGDFDATGTSDLLLIHHATGELAMSRSQDTSTATVSLLGAPQAPWEFATTGDFDGDGRADIIWRRSDDGNLAVWLMDGDTVRASHDLSGPAPIWTLLGSADLDGDGTSDLVWRDDRGSVSAWHIQGAAMVAESTVGYHATARWDYVGSGDMDGDGRDDLIWRRKGLNRVRSWAMNGLSKQGEKLIHLRNEFEDIVMVGDYDGDGLADLLTQLPTTGALEIYLLDGSGLRSSSVIGQLGVDQTAVGVR